MLRPDFTPHHRRLGRYASWAAFLVAVAYAVTRALGPLSLESAQDPIDDPYFSLLELLIVIIAPMMVAVMVAVHGYVPRPAQAGSLTALAFMLLLAGITTSVHVVVLTVSREFAASEPALAPLLVSFEWPSVAYALDILAWDVFFALAMLCAAPVFTEGRLERAIRLVMIASGVLSLVGVIGVPLGDMQVRLIGVLGYAGVAPIAFLLLAILVAKKASGTQNLDTWDPR